MISIIGCGYIGLISAICWASKGHTVHCVDIDLEKIDQLKSGQLPFYEKGLDDLFEKHKSNIRFSSNFSLITDSKYIIMALGTPRKDDGSIDISQVEKALDLVLDNKNIGEKEKYIIFRSTMPPGTVESLLMPKTIK